MFGFKQKGKRKEKGELIHIAEYVYVGAIEIVVARADSSFETVWNHL